ncbi:Gusb [Symbiodinium pilosum]|uniref:Gusb protein n=1 Tax=Symbiodinium pilosum TaxID=2952 RepID=A0A812Y9Y7_SYMPI|nr:Gusb [Symbiodinium pilosum]
MAAESAEKLSNLEISTSNLAARLAAIEDAALVGRVAALEGACLEERLALLETSRPVFSGGPVPAAAGALNGPSPASVSQVLSLREEVHRVRNRVGVLEQLVQIPDAQFGQTEPKSPLFADGSPKLGSPRRLEGDEDMKRSLSDLWCAVSGDQRTLGILSSKMEDAVRDFLRLQTRFEAAMPQLLQMLSELLRRNGGGTGEAGDGAEMDVLVAMQKLLFGAESGMPFVSPQVLRETFGAFEAVIRSELERLRDEFFKAVAEKAKIEDMEFLAEQTRLLHGQLQMLWQNFEKLIAGEKESNAAIWRTPLHARCVSCDKKVDIKGMVLLDRDPAFLPTQSPSPVPYERASSARRARGPRDLCGSRFSGFIILIVGTTKGTLNFG